MHSEYVTLVFLVSCWIFAVARLESDSSMPFHCLSTVNSTEACATLDDILENVESNTVITVNPGMNLIRKSHLLNGISNVRIIGFSASSSIVCSGNSGIALVNVMNITVESLSIYDCGLNYSVLEDAIDELKMLVDVWFVIPLEVRIGLFIGYGQNVNLTGVTVTRTKGIGILAINIMGESYFSSVLLSQNQHTDCSRRLVDSESFEHIGGGAYFLYFDFHDSNPTFLSTENYLTVSNAKFVNNSDCSNAAQIYVNYRFHLSKRLQYVVGGGGGLSVVYAHSSFSVTARILDTFFHGNIARYGSGAHVVTFANFSMANSVSFENCVFSRNGNGSSDRDVTAYSYGGAGLAVFSDLFKPSFFKTPITAINNVTVSVKNTLFESNVAEIEGGGIYAHSLGISPHEVYDAFSGLYYSIHWQLKNVSFIRNGARVIAAAAFSQRTYFGIDGSVLLVLDSVKVKNSYSLLRNGRSPLNQEVYSAMCIRQVVTFLEGFSLFEQNDITALYVISTVLFCQNHSILELRKNQGYRGGALYMEGYSPALILSTNVSVNFSENRGNVEGGAVYFSVPGTRKDALEPSHLFGCFISTLFFDVPKFFSFNNTIIFHENNAPLGSSIFGADLKFCPWSYLVGTSGNIYQTLHEKYSSTFIFSQAPNKSEQVSSTASTVNVKGPSTALPGETQNIDITVFDRFSNDIFSIVTTDSNSANRSFLGDSGYAFTSQGNSTVQVFGPENSTSLVSYFTIANIVTATQGLNLLSCPAGFEFDEGQQACICSHLLEKLAPTVTCTNISLTITVQNGHWLGTDLSNINSSSTEDLLFHSCFFDFCGGATFRPPDYDSQCAKGSMRTGVMCGACKEGFSETFGSVSCRKCSNYIFFFFIVLGAIVELGLFIAIAFFGFTVDKGWMYALVYYSSLLALYFFYSLPLFEHFAVFFGPTAALTLEGFYSICFYDGMTAIERYSIQLAFPVYYFILVIIFRFISQEFSFLNARFSPAKTFATVAIICYVNLLLTSSTVFPGVGITTLGNEHSIRWLRDPSYSYFNNWHIPITFAIYIVTIVFLLGCPVLLLFPKLLYNFRFLRKGMPFYDALYAPFKDKYRFWLGVKLLILFVTFSLSRGMHVRHSLFINTLILLVVIHIQATLKPYKSYWLNIVDSYFIMAALLLMLGASSVLNSESVSNVARVFYSLMSLVLPFLIFVAVICYNLHLQFPVIQEVAMKAMHRFLVRKKRKRDSSILREQPSHQHLTNSDSSFSGQVTVSQLAIEREIEMSMSLLNMNVRYREPLFDDTLER